MALDRQQVQVQVPVAARLLREPLIHTADYLENREALLESGAITIVGSGQSAAEIYRDLIDDAEDRGVRLDWVTRSPRFFPMEYTKLTLEMTSPEYTDHFRALPDELRERVGREQRTLYKGISADLVDDIHDTLYRLSRCGRQLLTNLISEAELETADIDPISGEYLLGFRNTALGKTFTRRSGSVVAATGYKSQVPDFLSPSATISIWTPAAASTSAAITRSTTRAPSTSSTAKSTPTASPPLTWASAPAGVGGAGRGVRSRTVSDRTRHRLPDLRSAGRPDLCLHSGSRELDQWKYPGRLDRR